MITPVQSKMARAALGLGIRDFAELAGVGVSTIQRFENGTGDLSDAKIAELQAVFEQAGIEFIPENGGGAGVRLSSPSGAESAK